jgi:hypothetical protein
MLLSRRLVVVHHRGVALALPVGSGDHLSTCNCAAWIPPPIFAVLPWLGQELATEIAPIQNRGLFIGRPQVNFSIVLL